MKDVCIAYADKSGNGFSVSEPWIEDNFNTLEDCVQKANDLKEEGYQHVILFTKEKRSLKAIPGNMWSSIKFNVPLK